jgi:hypothetical protein
VISKRKANLLLFGSALLSLAMFPMAPSASAKWKYFRAGNAADSTARPRAGFALMGGGEQDPALKFLCERANGGDFLILRANTEDDYAQKVNEEIRALCPLNSAMTPMIQSCSNASAKRRPSLSRGAINRTTSASGKTLPSRTP